MVFNMNNNELISEAKEILNMNDLGGYTVPTHGLYPFQWNWDAAITALGWMKIDEARAWEEIHSLMKGQWPNGMVPHIIFHQDIDSYYPNASVWGVERELKTTSISQPPVLASVVKIMFETATDKTMAKENMDKLITGLIRYHTWWYQERDPENTGLVVSYHPWESGMDNSPAWDDALAAVPPVDWQYKRKDTEHIDAEERPHQFEYDRYLYLVDFFKQCNFDSQKIFQNCPYKMYDIGIISILHKATKDLLQLAEYLSIENDATNSLKANVKLTNNAISQLWSEEHQGFLNKDAITGKFSQVHTTGTIMAIYGGLASEQQAEVLKSLLNKWLSLTNYGVSSTIASSESYEAQRYWRGPVWLHINWLLYLGAEEYQMSEISAQIKKSAYALISEQGYFEYFNCETGKGCGGNKFSWTAATALHWLL